MEEKKIAELKDEDLENVVGGTESTFKEVNAGDIYVDKNNPDRIIKVMYHTNIDYYGTEIPCIIFTKLSKNEWQVGKSKYIPYNELVAYYDFCPDYFLKHPII